MGFYLEIALNTIDKQRKGGSRREGDWKWRQELHRKWTFVSF